MRGRPNVHNHDEIVEKAQKVFWEKGFSATSLNDLLDVTGVGSGSLYNAFKGGKREIFSKALQQRREVFLAFCNQLDASENPIELIRDFFRSVANDDVYAHKRGCIIANSVVEMTFVDTGLNADAINILKDVEKMFCKTIRQAQQDGKIRNPVDPEILGRYLVTFWCGLNTLRRMYPNPVALRQQIEFQLSILS